MSRPLPGLPITAYGFCNALGASTDVARGALFEGRTGLGPPPFELPFETHAGRVPTDFEPLPAPATELDTRMTRLVWGATTPMRAAIQRAVETWGPDRVAIVVGSSTGGIEETERAVGHLARHGRLPETYSFGHKHQFDALVETLARLTGARGPRYVISTACSSSAKALASAQRLIASDVADAVLAGGADSLCHTTLRGFHGLRILADGPCRPFDVSRNGLCIGEGGAFLLIERDASARTYLLGVGETSDAHHMTAPDPDGTGGTAAIEAALAQAALEPDAIGYVNAHGTGTPLNDVAESRIIASTLGTRVPVSSTKGLTGHLLGAAGATEAAFCVAALERGVLPANAGLRALDPKVAVNVIGGSTRADVSYALSNSFGFGGSNASVVLGARASASPSLATAKPVHVVGLAYWARGYPTLGARLEGAAHADEQTPTADILSVRDRARASLLTAMFAETVGQLGWRADLSRVPIVYGAAHGEMETTMKLLRMLYKGEGRLAPLKFMASVHNSAAGVISIATKNRAYSTSLAAGTRTFAMALLEALAWLRVHGGEVIVAVAEEPVPSELVPAPPYGPFAAAVHLATGDEVRDSVGRVADLREEAVADAGGVWAECEGSPIAGAARFVEAIARGRAGRIPLDDDGWSIELLPTGGSGVGGSGVRSGGE